MHQREADNVDVDVHVNCNDTNEHSNYTDNTDRSLIPGRMKYITRVRRSGIDNSTSIEPRFRVCLLSLSVRWKLQYPVEPTRKELHVALR